MSLYSAALTELQGLVPAHVAPVLAAIGLAESSSGAPGDAIGSAGIPSTPYQCGGYTSFGRYQIHLPAHVAYLTGATGSADPCVWAAWLGDLHNSTLAAAHVYHSQGLGAWTTYQTGAYVHYLPSWRQVLSDLNPVASWRAAFGPGSQKTSVAGNAVSTGRKVAHAVASPLHAVDGAIAALSKPGTWIRVALTVVSAGAVLVGVVLVGLGAVGGVRRAAGQS